jgi:hypothetical protein
MRSCSGLTFMWVDSNCLVGAPGREARAKCLEIDAVHTVN